MTNNKDNKEQLIQTFITEFGENELVTLLSERICNKDKTNILTIVANEGTHYFPENYIKGDKYVFSTGNFDATSEQTVKTFLEDKLVKLSNMLKQKKWAEIYLVPSGHPLLSLQIKLLVFRITRLETIDIAYFGEDGYYTIKINQRQLIDTNFDGIV